MQGPGSHHGRPGQRQDAGHRFDGGGPGQRHRGEKRSGRRKDRQVPGKNRRQPGEDHRGQEQARKPNREIILKFFEKERIYS